jgi:hypothetical protein
VARSRKESAFEESIPSLLEAFGEIPDHRRAQGRGYGLAGFLSLVTAAMIAGRRKLRSIRRWALKLRPAQLRRLGLKGVPSLGAFSTILSNVDAAACEAALARWAATAAGARAMGNLAIDGKSLRGSASEDGVVVHLVSVFETSARCVLAQMPIEKTNEAKIALELLDQVDVAGRLVTGDAAFAQRELCEKVIEKRGDYLVTVKDNQPTLRSDCQVAFEPPSSPFLPARS